jgi:hypothetical protein
LTIDHRPSTIDHLRKFGLVTSVPFLLLSGFLYYKGRPAAPYFLAPGLFLAVFGLIWPSFLGPVEKGWMWFAGKLQIVTTTIILSIAYYLLITPIALFMRLRGRDELELRRNEGGSYWKEHDREGSASRPMKPY